MAHTVLIPTIQAPAIPVAAVLNIIFVADLSNLSAYLGGPFSGIF
jgi:hypothetical protein